jgi:hypothetical protein
MMGIVPWGTSNIQKCGSHRIGDVEGDNNRPARLPVGVTHGLVRARNPE